MGCGLPWRWLGPAAPAASAAAPPARRGSRRRRARRDRRGAGCASGAETSPTIAAGKRRILVKPNLVFDDPRSTTRPAVVEALVRLLQRAGKEVVIGEGSGGARGFNVIGAEVFRTRDRA